MKRILAFALLLFITSGVAMAQFSLQALKAELLADPVGYGYAALIDAPTYNNFNPPAVADVLNTVRLGTDGFPSITVRNPSILTRNVLEQAIDIADFKNSPTVIDAAYFQAVMATQTVALIATSGQETFVFSNLKALFKVGTATLTRLTALANKSGTRAEQLWGPGTIISHQQVIDAVRLP